MSQEIFDRFDELWSKLKPEERFANVEYAKNNIRNLMLFGCVVSEIKKTNDDKNIFSYKNKTLEKDLYDFLDSSESLSNFMFKKNKGKNHD